MIAEALIAIAIQNGTLYCSAPVAEIIKPVVERGERPLYVAKDFRSSALIIFLYTGEKINFGERETRQVAVIQTGCVFVNK